mmetsp:Transcript_17943/g.42123  ORF Transcript_17943/g.42123 Transcript_17943/m.42123 type:complete len:256 (-) Transcript_17943:411-1178(-)
MRLISLAISLDRTELNSVSSEDASLCTSPTALAMHDSSFCSSTDHMTSCVKSWNRLGTIACRSSIFWKAESESGKTFAIFSQRSLGLNSSHFSPAVSLPRNKANVGVPLATGQPSGKSFFSMFNLFKRKGALFSNRSSPTELMKGLIKKQRKHVSSYICNNTIGFPGWLSSRTSFRKDSFETRGTDFGALTLPRSWETGLKKSKTSCFGISSPTCNIDLRCPLYMTIRSGAAPASFVSSSPAFGRGGSPSFRTFW